MIEVTFTAQQRQLIKAEAVRRQTENEKAGRRSRNNGASYGSKAMFHHQVGSAGEYAVALYLEMVEHLYLDRDPVRGNADLPCDIDVKARSKHYYEMLCQKDERPSKVLVLVTCEPRTSTRIHGWLYAHECMKPQYWKEWVPGRGCYSVPQSDLRSPESLKDYAGNYQHHSNLSLVR